MYYHVWFSTKRRRWLLQGDLDCAIKRSLIEVARRHGIQLIECETMVDHVHLLLQSEDQAALSRTMNLLKGGSSRIVNAQASEYKLDARTDGLWQKRYGARAVGAAELASVRRYIRSQKDRPEKYER